MLNKILIGIFIAVFFAAVIYIPKAIRVYNVVHLFDEDKIVKNFFYKCLRNKSLSRHLPELPEKKPSLEILTKKPILPCAKEIYINKRSRSAKLRIAKRTQFSSTFGEIA